MPRIADTAERHAFKFKGVDISAPFVYAPGHVLTDNEAKFINRQLVSTIGNILAGALTAQVKKLVDGDPKATPPIPGLSQEDALAKSITDGPGEGKSWQEFYDAKFADYEPGVNNRGEGTGAVQDPVAKLANSIAGDKVKELLKAKNIPFARVRGEPFAKLVAQYVEKNAWVSELAKVQIEAIKASGAEAPATDDLFEGVDLNPEVEASAEEAQEAPAQEAEAQTEEAEGPQA